MLGASSSEDEDASDSRPHKTTISDRDDISEVFILIAYTCIVLDIINTEATTIPVNSSCSHHSYTSIRITSTIGFG
jgi:hypothetical protein